VIQVRVEDPVPGTIGDAVVTAIGENEVYLQRGALVTLDPDTMRVRILPIVPGFKTYHRESLPNFTLKLVRSDFGPAAELPTSSPAWRRHGGCSLRFGSANVVRGNRRAAPASARGTGRTA
jgi:hypothetical protein